MILLGIDTGGTFTDFVLFDGKQIQIHKVLSTPSMPEKAILQGIHELGLDPAASINDLYIIHGSTVGTNAVLEGKGVKTAFICNKGFQDLLTLARQTRAELYDLCPQSVTPPVPESLCFEVSARLSADGSVIEALSENEMSDINQQLQKHQVESVAINLLFSFLDDSHEKQIETALPSNFFVSRSSTILPEYKEYERGMATWLNAWIGPVMENYLSRLHDALKNGNLSVMQSSGGTINAKLAGKHAVRLLLSGPAGGMAGARYVAACSGYNTLLTFDMGGTSTDVAMINGDIQLTSEGNIGPYPVAVPMVDMHTIGAGGGSIANVDAGGLLHVGPESAGADPGPACYGKGGHDVTVTDAHLVLGRIRAESFLGGAMRLDIKAAVDAMALLANKLELTVEQTAKGIISLVNENMVRALRVMSVQRGVDPVSLTLVSFGGAGGLHVCALADALKMQKAIIPMHAGVLSALGMLVAPRSRQLSRSVIGLLKNMDHGYLLEYFDELVSEGTRELEKEGVDNKDIEIESSVDLRYYGQSFYLNIHWPDNCSADLVFSQLTRLFHQQHKKLYRHALNQEVELVNVRVKVKGPELKLAINQQLKQRQPSTTNTGSQTLLAVERSDLNVDEIHQGPLLITESVSTTYVESGWQCHVDTVGNLILARV